MAKVLHADGAQLADGLAGDEVVGREGDVDDVGRIGRRVERDDEQAGLAGRGDGIVHARARRGDEDALLTLRDSVLDERSLALDVSVVLARTGGEVDAIGVGSLLGTRTILNELIAYEGLGKLKSTIHPRSFAITSFALCGFANFGSVGILVGGLGAMVPTDRRHEVVALGMRSLVSGTLATCMTGAVIGILT